MLAAGAQLRERTTAAGAAETAGASGGQGAVTG